MPLQFGSIVHFIGPNPKVLDAIQRRNPDHFLHKNIMRNTEALSLSGKDLVQFAHHKLNVHPPKAPLLEMRYPSELLNKISRQGRIEQSLFWVDAHRKKAHFERELNQRLEGSKLNPDQQAQLFFDYYQEAKRAKNGKDADGQDILEIVFPFPKNADIKTSGH
ncbi:hypothetical protein [Vampirovibrio sp.]|uniref:hypothetical protein n=1 Tax=Vampirovibrio sp. TaxID=2717857 RepID=UPI0035942F15